MNYTTKNENGIKHLYLHGRFDAHVTPEIRQWLEAEASKPPAQILVNLKEVNFIDSTALAALVQGMKRCRQQDGDLVLCNLQQPVWIIFELTRLDKAFAIFEDESGARDAFA